MKDPRDMTGQELDQEIENRKSWVEKELDRSIEKRVLEREKARRDGHAINCGVKGCVACEGGKAYL